MTTKINTKYIAHLDNQKPIDWIYNRFIPSNQRFPKWKNAAVTLMDFVEDIETFLITQQTYNPAALSAVLVMPTSLIRTQDNEEKIVDSIDLFPEDYKEDISQIWNQLVEDYLPDMEKFLGQNLTLSLIAVIEDEIRKRWHLIKERGGSSINNELAFRLGLNPQFMNTKEIKIQVKI